MIGTLNLHKCMIFHYMMTGYFSASSMVMINFTQFWKWYKYMITAWKRVQTTKSKDNLFISHQIQKCKIWITYNQLKTKTDYRADERNYINTTVKYEFPKMMNQMKLGKMECQLFNHTVLYHFKRV